MPHALTVEWGPGVARVSLVLAALALWLGLLGAPAAWAAEPLSNETCLSCHEGSVSAALDASRHAGFECVMCHAGIRDVPHAERLPRVRCAACHEGEAGEMARSVHRPQSGRRARTPGCVTCHGSHDIQPAAALGVAPCQACHGPQVADQKGSVHGQGPAGKEGCAACHGPTHQVRPSGDPGSPTFALRIPHTCARCHGGAENGRPADVQNADVYHLYLDSVHGRALTRGGLLVAAGCVACHGSHGITHRTDPRSRVSREHVVDTCGACHAGVKAQYFEGIHGAELKKGNPVVPVCNDCHTAHEIRHTDAPAWQLGVVEECGTCHTESLATFRDTFHGQVAGLGFTRVARCADCHGAHDILPKSDPASRVNPANVVETCRACHPAANGNFARYDPHANVADRLRNPSYYYASVLMKGLLVGVFGFFGLHTVLWAGRSLLERRRGPRHGG